MSPNQFPQIEQAPNPSHEAYARAVTEVAAFVPEVAEKQASIERSGREVIDTFGLKPELFEDPARSLVFTTIADRWSQLPTEQEDNEAARSERHFLTDAVTLLGSEYSDSLAAVAHEHNTQEDGVDDATALKVYERYTDPTLTKEMKAAIDDGMLSQVKERLGITEDNEEPYELRVLSIDSKGSTGHGLVASTLDWENLPKDYKESRSIINAHEKERQDVKDYHDGLQARALEMAKEMGTEELFAPAWVDHRKDGSKILCISMPLAEKLLDPGLTKNAKYYTEEDWGRDFAILEHEYTHSQGGMNIDASVKFGINLEELRAEHFSGNKQGYQDIKGLFLDTWVASGFDVKEMFDKLPKGGTQTEIYAAMANHLGLRNTLDMLLAAPRNYIQSQSDVFQVEAFNYIDGYDGPISRIIEDEAAAGRGEQMMERVDQRVKRMREIVPDLENRRGLYNMRRRNGLNVMADLVESRDEATLPAA